MVTMVVSTVMMVMRRDFTPAERRIAWLLILVRPMGNDMFRNPEGDQRHFGPIVNTRLSCKGGPPSVAPGLLEEIKAFASYFSEICGTGHWRSR